MNMGGGGNKLQSPMKRTIKIGWKFEQMEKMGFCDRLWKNFVTFMKNLFAWLFCFYLFVFFLSAQVRLSAQPKVFAIKQAPRALIDHIRYIEFKHYIKDILNVNEWNPETAYKANATEKKIFEEQVGSLKTENEKTSRS